jgi:hypothetical protein
MRITAADLRTHLYESQDTVVMTGEEIAGRCLFMKDRLLRANIT